MKKSFARLGNVEELEYQIFYHPSNAAEPPYFPPDDSLRHVEFNQLNQPVGPVVDRGQWRLVFLRKLKLDLEKTQDWQHPVYKYYVKELGSARDFAPDFAVKKDSIFVYSEQETQRLAQLPPDFTVNIGTVKLKIKDLRVVQKELQRSLSALNLPGAEDLAHGKLDIEEFNRLLNEAKQKVVKGEVNLDMEPTAVVNKLDLYSYIVKLRAESPELPN